MRTVRFSPRSRSTLIWVTSAPKPPGRLVRRWAVTILVMEFAAKIFGRHAWGVSFALLSRCRDGPPLLPHLPTRTLRITRPGQRPTGRRWRALIIDNDPHVNALVLKGVGRNGITVSGCAVANAVLARDVNFAFRPFSPPWDRGTVDGCLKLNIGKSGGCHALFGYAKIDGFSHSSVAILRQAN